MAPGAPPAFAPWLGIFETLRVSAGVPLFEREHLAEWRRAAAALGLPLNFDPARARAKLTGASGRWRWITTPAGTRTLLTREGPASAAAVALSISPLRVGAQNWDARFKTLSYLTHAQALRIAVTPEVILLNEHRQIAGAARANLFWRRGPRLFTPAHEAGCRCGVIRGFVLARREVEEGFFPPDDLLQADEVFLTNSIRGIVPVRSVEGRALASQEAARQLRREYGAAVKKQIANPRRA